MIRLRGYSAGTAPASTFTVTVPAGTVNGDLMLVWMESLNGGITPPAGWNLIAGGTTTQKQYWRIASSEPASYAFTFSSGNWAHCRMTVYYDDGGASLSVASGTCGSYNGHPTLVVPNQSVSARDVVQVWGTGNNGSSCFTPLQCRYIVEDNAGNSPAGNNSTAAFYQVFPSASGSAAIASMGTVDSSNLNWNYGVIVITGGTAPAKDYRVRVTQQVKNSSGSGTLSSTGIVSGDLIVLAIAGDTGTPTTPTGFTPLAHDSTQFPFYLFTRIATGSESATYSVVSGGAVLFAALIAVYDNGGAALSVISSQLGNSASAAVITAHAITPLAAGDLILSICTTVNTALTSRWEIMGLLDWETDVSIVATSGPFGEFASFPAINTSSLTPPQTGLYNGGSVTWQTATLDIGVPISSGIAPPRLRRHPRRAAKLVRPPLTLMQKAMRWIRTWGFKAPRLRVPRPTRPPQLRPRRPQTMLQRAMRIPYPPAWPASLPQNQFTGLSEQRGSAMLRTAMETGPAKSRPRFSKASRNFKIPLTLTGAQRVTFDSFFRMTLYEGSIPFLWTDPVTDSTLVFRFVKPPAWSLEAGGTTNLRVWKTTLELEVLP
jgi:hypothetical protein